MEDTFNIAMHFELEDFHSRVQTILNELHIYDDRVYVNAYKEYQDHYKVYDRVPDLLLYKIPVLFANSYPGIEAQTLFFYLFHSLFLGSGIVLEACQVQMGIGVPITD